MPERDRSAVYHIDMLDSNERAAFDPTRPWLFENDEDITIFDTEDQACAWQRAYRSNLGFDPITGERA